MAAITEVLISVAILLVIITGTVVLGAIFTIAIHVWAYILRSLRK